MGVGSATIVAALMSGALGARVTKMKNAEKNAEMTCGQELAQDAEVPRQLAALMSHVAGNMETHARWVAATEGGQREQDALLAVAAAYRGISEAADRASHAMTAMKDLPAVAHDPTRMNWSEQARWMRAKIDLQLKFAQLLTEHAKASKQALAKMPASDHHPDRRTGPAD